MNRNLLTRITKKFLSMNGYYQLDKDAHTSFSQMAEDLILMQMFEGRKKGFYVDVGAFHPTLYSNTYIFYLKGWRGINIDAMPQSMEDFKKLRPRDINIEAAISNDDKEVEYFRSNGSALNTISKERVKVISKMKNYRITDKIILKCRKLKDILEENLPKDQKITFMNIDVEGSDLKVLQSNDWKKFRPEVIIVESLSFSLKNPKKDKVYNFLSGKKYTLIAKSDVSLIFKSNL